MSTIVEVFNQKCKPHKPFETNEECITYLFELKNFLFDPRVRSIHSFINSPIPTHPPADCSTETLILYHALGIDDKNVTVDALKRLEYMFNTIQVQQGGDQPLAMARYRNGFLNHIQQLFMMLNLNPDLTEENAMNACDVVQQLRAKCGNDFSSDFIDLLIQKHSSFTTDFMLVAPIIQYSFGDTVVVNSTQQLVKEFMTRVKQFEDSYNCKFINVIKKCFNNQLPVYQETTQHEFLLSAEKKDLCDMIWEAFQIKTDHPIHFYTSYYCWIIKEVQQKAQIQKPLDYCMIKYLNSNILVQVSNLYYAITLKRIQFATVEDFIKELSALIKKFNKSQLIKLNELCQFAVYDLNISEGQKGTRVMKVLYNQQIFVTNEHNKQIREQLLRPFQPETYLQIEEVKEECDNYQSLFVLDTLIRKLYEIINITIPGNTGLFEKLEDYCEKIVVRASLWFGESKKPGFSQMKKDISKFSSNYISSQCTPVSYFAKAFASLYQIPLQIKAYEYDCERSELTEYLVVEQFQLPYHNIGDFYLYVIVPFFQKMKQNMMVTLKYQAESSELAMLATLAKQIFGDDAQFVSVDQFKQCLDNNGKTKYDLKENFECFGYYSKLIEKAQFAFSEDLADHLKNLMKIFKIECNKPAAADITINMLILLTQIRTELWAVTQPPRDCLVSYLQYMDGFRKYDTALIPADDWVSTLARLLLPETIIGDILTSKASKYDLLRQVQERFLGECSKILKVHTPMDNIFLLIDEKNLVRSEQFIKVNRELEGKINSKQEKFLKEFTQKLSKFYVLNKKAYGSDLLCFVGLVQLVNSGNKRPLVGFMDEEHENLNNSRNNMIIDDEPTVSQPTNTNNTNTNNSGQAPETQEYDPFGQQNTAQGYQ
ncbi:Conserved_hypothetical protein [Hexamita inflata]|uniref:Uncharacterized protein n=1 Tax=Hexamita inflata TaxID=28002 RepID=A0ABP1JFK3_9EUKA